MLRMILTQLRNRWRNNISILLELCLVFCFLWYITDYFFVLNFNYHLPSHQSLEDTWQIKLGTLPDTHSEYQEAAADSMEKEANFLRIIDRLKQMPEVEAIAFFRDMSTPGGESYYGRGILSPQDTTLWINGMWHASDIRGDYFKVFHYTDPEGKEVSLQDFPINEHSVILDETLAKILFPNGQAVGKEIVCYMDGRVTYQVVGVVGNTKRFDYLRPTTKFYSFERANGSNCTDYEIAIRLKNGVKEAEVIGAFKNRLTSELRIGNYYLLSFDSYKHIHQQTDKSFGISNEIRSNMLLFLFFLLNIILCVIGTFWYRISRRKGEIGLQMAMGATRANIRWIFYWEGICLMSVAGIIAMFIEIQLVALDMTGTLGAYDGGNYLPDNKPLRFLITNFITWCILAVSIVIAIYIPANQASHMNPSDALRDE